MNNPRQPMLAVASPQQGFLNVVMANAINAETVTIQHPGTSRTYHFCSLQKRN